MPIIRPYTPPVLGPVQKSPFIPPGAITMLDLVDKIGKETHGDWTGKEATGEATKAFYDTFLSAVHAAKVAKDRANPREKDRFEYVRPVGRIGNLQVIPQVQSLPELTAKEAEGVRLQYPELQAAADAHRERFNDAIQATQMRLYERHHQAFYIDDDGQRHEIEINIWAGKKALEIIRSGYFSGTTTSLRETSPAYFAILIDEKPTAKTIPFKPELVKNKGGAPKQHDWEAARNEVLRIADQDGLPDKKSDLYDHIQQFLIDTSAPNKSPPDISTIRKYCAKWIKHPWGEDIAPDSETRH